ncbi:ribonuclease P protein component [Roseateles sp. DB2]|uniref:ribonuclease P protein component n=1 Tax=Roseateles sp. DB2 TaxID=3453717 RepID=UPI003EEB7108
MIGRIERSADFERVLGQPSRVRSKHFAVHHLMAAPSLPGHGFSTVKTELSTGHSPIAHSPVDESTSSEGVKPDVTASPAVPDGHWLGCVVPKRHARRAVTRSLIKRQIRAVFADVAGLLPPGLWVVRLRMPVDRKQFPSAASEPLKALVREELLHLRAKLSRSAPADAAAVPRG